MTKPISFSLKLCFKTMFLKDYFYLKLFFIFLNYFNILTSKIILKKSTLYKQLYLKKSVVMKEIIATDDFTVEAACLTNKVNCVFHVLTNKIKLKCPSASRWLRKRSVDAQLTNNSGCTTIVC